MTRRVLFQILAPGPYGAQKFGATNPPTCPLCHTQQPPDAPEYLPIIRNADGTTASLTNVRQCFCGNCGVQFVVAAK